MRCDDAKPSCARCAKAGIECIRGYNIRFRHGANPSVNLKGGPQCDYDFSRSQTWLKTALVLNFVDESQDVANIYDIDTSDSLLHDASAQSYSPPSSDTPPQQAITLPSLRQLRAAHDKPTETPSVGPSTDDCRPSSSNSPCALMLRSFPCYKTNTSIAKRRRVLDDSIQPHPHPSTSPFDRVPLSMASPSSVPFDFSSFGPMLDTSSPLPLGFTPDIREGHTPVDLDLNPDAGCTDIITSNIYLRKSIWPLSNYEEAHLVRYYAAKVAPNLDMCDPVRHFELVVPVRAATCPILHNAILAAAARQLSRLEDFDPYVSNSYQQECLNHLIPLLSDEAAVLDENLLAAAVLLRYIEEIDTPVTASDTDPDNAEGSHMFGTNIFMAAQEHFTLAGGLRHAAYFTALRQELYCAFAHQRSVAPALTHGNIDRGLGPADDATWANRIVVHNADVIRFCFDPAHDRSPAQHAKLLAYSAGWMAAKPDGFAPLFHRDASAAAPGPARSVFPETWLHAPHAVAAMQHYHLCAILLAAHDPRVPRLGPSRAAGLAAADAKIRASVLRLCGVAVANDSVRPAFVYASLAIGMAGERFGERDVQEALLGVLERTERCFAWPTGRARRALKAAWGW